MQRREFIQEIDYIIQKIYVKKEIKPFCKNSIFIKLLKKLTQECVFTINKMEEDIVIPANPIFYKRYVDDTYKQRKKHLYRFILMP